MVERLNSGKIGNKVFKIYIISRQNHTFTVQFLLIIPIQFTTPRNAFKNNYHGL